ncbi:type I-G CRISPR-associated helicase/endonuclease Cas3g [Paludibaculum fermentans]|uniref:type I-G CRISPR-associated helicase/endonuclease Cas3g n=1 Tax=Paludibaculum fermentans TaxID=1473598 RepID=UPI003EB8AAA7
MSQLPPIKQWFQKITGHTSPHDWQRKLLALESCRSQIVRVPTGLGKTEGVLAAWSYHRICKADRNWPRRLIWCLPMRTLVEQTEHVARELAARIPAEMRPEVFTLMGGQDSGEWFLYPERPAIIVGTQDMLLSRALNRGFASGRARWPVEFGLFNQDALWIMDEVQLMDVGLATSAQLQAFREQDHEKQIRSTFTWWMSATVQPEWLTTTDTVPFHTGWIEDPCRVEPEERLGSLWTTRKPLSTKTVDASDSALFARLILNGHNNIQLGGLGKISLVVCNTVDRAIAVYDALKQAGRTQQLELVHSRFRAAERRRWRQQFLTREACNPTSDLIIVSTQVVEAGVDISAGSLFTELAPWSSLVQRFGRCARYGGFGQVTVVNRGTAPGEAAPYMPADLEASIEAIASLDDVSVSSLESFEDSLTIQIRARLYPYSPDHLLLRRDFDELFDTTPDLTGADLDISRFIRSGEERDLQVFWLEVDNLEAPPNDRRPFRNELCAVPFLKARNWLCGDETKTKRKPHLRPGIRAWVWDWIDGTWIEPTRSSLLPGRIVCVAAESGGYSTTHGFDPQSRQAVPPAPIPPVSTEHIALESADNQQDGEALSISRWKCIASHSHEVVDEVLAIGNSLSLPERLTEILAVAGTWHDWGKAHPAFQGAMRASDRPAREDLAKAPNDAWLRPRGTYRFLNDSETRPALRHELASALGLFSLLETYDPGHPALLGPWTEAFTLIGLNPAVPTSTTISHNAVRQVVECSAEEFNLVAYLIASHHGKVRIALHSAPLDQSYVDRDGRGLPIRGVRESDTLPSILIRPGLPPIEPMTLTLEPAALGLSTRTGSSWRERTISLLHSYGPSGLAYLEALFRAADVRASRRSTEDPVIPGEVRK